LRKDEGLCIKKLVRGGLCQDENIMLGLKKEKKNHGVKSFFGHILKARGEPSTFDIAD